MGRGRMLGAVVWVTLVPAALHGQTGQRVACADGAAPVGSLGIRGIACDRCRFFTNGKAHTAVFWTEPTILDLDPANPAATVLHEGDVVLAVDGRLITTREGSERFSSLRSDAPARLRVRRDGRVLDLEVPVSAVCPATRAAEAPSIEGRPVPAPPSPPRESNVPRTAVAHALPPGGRAAQVPVPPALPAPETGIAPLPALPPEAPSASLGFAFQCSRCSYQYLRAEGRGAWSFSEPPEVTGTEGRPGAGGLRPGDRLVALGGAALTTAEGGRRFAAAAPGDTLRWTVERGGRRMEVTSVAGSRAGVAAAPEAPRPPQSAQAAAAPDPSTAPIRFSGVMGNTTIEVRGWRGQVIEDEGGKLLIIRTGDAEIRIRLHEGG